MKLTVIFSISLIISMMGATITSCNHTSTDNQSINKDTLNPPATRKDKTSVKTDSLAGQDKTEQKKDE